MTEAMTLEHSVIGALCYEPRYITRIADKLFPEDFSISLCAEIYAAALEVNRSGQPFDAVIAAKVISPRIGENEAGEFIYFCMTSSPSAENAEYHAKLLHEQAITKRFLESATHVLLGEKFSGQEIACKLSGMCQDFLKTESTDRIKPLSKALMDMYNGQIKTGLRIDTGFRRLDGILKGIWGGNLCMIGAKTGVGKTAFALSIAEAAARSGNCVLIYSLEMLADELAERLVAKKSWIELDHFIDNDLTPEQWKETARACGELSKLPIYINDEPNITVEKIHAEARMIQDCKMIIIDFVSLMHSGTKQENRNLELGSISRDLKNLAGELRIPIILLSQLSRGADEYERPALKHLRDSGELEQNANKCILLWKIDDTGKVGVYVAKNRRGKTGAVIMNFDGAHMRFSETVEEYKSPKKSRHRIFDDDED